jgi:hypothetical protein
MEVHLRIIGCDEYQSALGSGGLWATSGTGAELEMIYGVF